jgi:H+/Cl- antiporter ClcA
MLNAFLTLRKEPLMKRLDFIRYALLLVILILSGSLYACTSKQYVAANSLITNTEISSKSSLSSNSINNLSHSQSSLLIHKHKSIYSYEHRNFWFIPIWFLILAILAYAVGKMIKRDPMISGSGIPQVEGVLLGHLDMNWWKLIIRNRNEELRRKF